MKTNTTYSIRVSAAKMPNSCWGVYRHVAVLEVVAGSDPATWAIDERRRNVVRIVRYWDRLNVGTSDRCAFARAYDEAKALAARLNAGKVAS